jgi:hypothetical protein
MSRGAFVAAIALAASLAGSATATAATNQPTFARTDYQQLGNNHVIADFNGDGRPDIAGMGAQSAAVYLAAGAPGSFGPRAEYPVASWLQDLAAGDFNNDGRQDLIVTINDEQIGGALLEGNGNGTFKAPVNFANTAGFDSPAIVATDLDDDGRLDVVIAHEIACYTAPCRVTELISVMMGNGDGTFQPSREIQVGRGMLRIAVGDFNRDGVKDLAIAGDSSRLYRLYGAGDGTFVQQPTLTMTADTFAVDATDVDVADFNGDAIQDLVVAVALNGSRTAVLIGNADGTFRAPLILTDPLLNVPQYQAVGDYNGDGFQDLALAFANGSNGLMGIRNGNGDGTFQAQVMHQMPPPKSSIGSVAIVAGNLNGDGRPDLALAVGGASAFLSVLNNTTGVAAPATPAAPALVSPAQDATPTQPVALDWSDVTAATSYRIQIDDSSTFSSPIVVDQTVVASQFTAPTLAARQHWWRVRGVNSAGTAGAWSAVRRFTPRATTPAPAPAALSAVAVSPASVSGGASAQGTVTLTAPAPAGGFAVTLASSSTAATVPASVTVAPGATSATFAIATSTVTSSTAVTITASAGAVTRTATLTVTPPAQAATLTVQATGRSGERIASSPAGITVAVGSTGSASFAPGTRITLSVSGGRDAVWSGACTSGKAKSCAFTLGGTAGVTANVQ